VARCRSPLACWVLARWTEQPHQNGSVFLHGLGLGAGEVEKKKERRKTATNTNVCGKP
jgi:hypothetical protein